MIGDNLSPATHKKLKLWGTVVLLGFYTLCVVQASQWGAYSIVCGPVTMVLWIWGLEACKRPRETGKIANFGTPFGSPLGGRNIEITGSSVEIQRGLPANFDFIRDSFAMVGLIARPDSHPVDTTPGGQPIKFDEGETVEPSKPVTPLVLVSRYNRVLDPTSWVL